MTERARPGAEELPVKWLTAAEVDSWLSVVRLMTWLPWSIDQQLQRDSNRASTRRSPPLDEIE